MSKYDPIPADRWQWFGHAGHSCVGSRCLFHLCTRIGSVIVSTVGDYYPNRKGDVLGEKATVGCGRFFETYVFWCGRVPATCSCGCGLPLPESWSEIDSLPANDAPTARANHMELCHRAASRSYAKPKQ